MKYIGCMTSLLILAGLSGCGTGSSDDNTGKSNNTEPVTLSVPATPASSNTAPVVLPATNTPVVGPTSNTVTLGTQQPVKGSVSTAGINPEHGKPGHRCDIAVGAPLDSKPTFAVPSNQPTNNNPTSPVSVNNTTVSTAPVINTNPVAAGMNPEHGKPGHRCDIAVGAPLDSKPTNTVVNTQPATITTSPTTITQPPVINTSPAGNTTTGLNPEHGKPGHRCDIAVGAPLDSKPKQ